MTPTLTPLCFRHPPPPTVSYPTRLLEGGSRLVCVEKPLSFTPAGSENSTVFWTFLRLAPSPDGRPSTPEWSGVRTIAGSFVCRGNHPTDDLSGRRVSIVSLLGLGYRSHMPTGLYYRLVSLGPLFCHSVPYVLDPHHDLTQKSSGYFVGLGREGFGKSCRRVLTLRFVYLPLPTIQ